MNKKKRYGACFLAYTILFLMLGGLLYGIVIWKDGRSFIGEGDGLAQHYPALYYIGGYVRNAVNTFVSEHRISLPLVDYSIGEGMDVLTTLNYYGFGDPLYLIAGFFPENRMETCYNFLVLLRMFLSGAGFLAYGLYVREKQEGLIIGAALGYAFCGFALLGGIKHPIFFSGMLYLPPLCLGVERILREKKYLFFSFSVMFCLMSNFYFAYMNTILVVLYALIRLLWKKELHWKQKIVSLFKLGFGYLAGMGLSAVIFLPVVYAFINNARSGSAQVDWASLFAFRWTMLKKIILNISFSHQRLSDWTCVGFSMLAVPSIAALFVCRGKKEERRTLWALRTGVILCIIMVCVPAFGKIMNGFSYICNRWFYAGAFLTGVVILYAIPALMDASGIEIGITTAISFAWIYYVITQIKVLYTGRKVVLLCMVLSLAAVVIRHFWKKLSVRYFESVLAMLMVCAVALNTYVFVSPSNMHMLKKYAAKGRVEELIQATPVDEMPQLSDEEGFYRLGQERKGRNISLLSGKNLHNYYYSISPQTLADFYCTLGLTTLKYSFMFHGLDKRTILNELTATKYFVKYKTDESTVPYGYFLVDENEKTEVWKNDYFLPLGFTYSSYVTREEFEKLDAQKREVLLLQSAVLEEELPELEKADPEKLEYPVTEKKAAAVNTEKASYENGVLQGEKKSELTIRFEGEEGCETWLCLEGIRPRNTAEVKVISAMNTDTVVLNPGNSRRTEGRSFQLVDLGYSSDAQTECTLHFKSNVKADIENIKVFCYNVKQYPEQAARLGETTLQDTVIGTNQISGNISLEQPELLYMSIPYSAGWKAYVDGKKTEILKANLSYMAVPIESGTHTVVFKYMTPFMGEGAAITVLTAGIILVWHLFKRRKQYPKKI